MSEQTLSPLMKNLIRRNSCRIPFLLLPLQCSPGKALSQIFDAGDDPGFLLFYIDWIRLPYSSLAIGSSLTSL